MRFIVLICLFSLLSFRPADRPSFKERQMSYKNVYEAFREKWDGVYSMLKSADIDPYNYDLYIRGFKFEDDLEVWAKNRDELTYTYITKYKFCRNVGELGPKRREGDMQIPEGVYYMNQFNPESNYFLSLKVSYPNKSDSILGNRRNLGGLIFIHGGCNTIGCIPITNDKIKELYVLCVQARHSGQEKIPIHLFPARLSRENLKYMLLNHKSPMLHKFWTELKICYDLFEKTKKIPEHSVNNRGEYSFSEGLRPPLEIKPVQPLPVVPRDMITLAYEKRGDRVYSLLKTAGINPENYDLYLRAFKSEDKLEVWARNRRDSNYVLIETYDLCNNTSILGPKRRASDKNIPEGIYAINRFNPLREYGLSLQINYPNKSDSILGDYHNLGEMILIHGQCHNSLCIPVKDDKISELFILCHLAKTGGQANIPIHIFPSRLDQKNLNLLTQQYSDQDAHRLWKSMKKCYDLFEASHRVPRYTISFRGEYFFFEGNP